MTMPQRTKCLCLSGLVAVAAITISRGAPSAAPAATDERPGGSAGAETHAEAPAKPEDIFPYRIDRDRLRRTVIFLVSEVWMVISSCSAAASVTLALPCSSLGCFCEFQNLQISSASLDARTSKAIFTISGLSDQDPAGTNAILTHGSSRPMRHSPIAAA